MSESTRANQDWAKWEQSRKDRSIIVEGLTAVSKILSRYRYVDEELSVFSASKYELMLLLHQYWRDALSAYDLYFFYGQCGGELEKLQRAHQGIERLETILGRHCVKEMEKAAEKEHEAKIRASLCSEGLALYEGLPDTLDEWHVWNNEH